MYQKIVVKGLNKNFNSLSGEVLPLVNLQAKS